MADAIPFQDYVAIVAPLPRPGAVVEGWMARIRAVDEIFLDRGRIYLHFDPSAPPNEAPVTARFGDAVEYRVHPLSEKHRATIEAVILGSRFTYVHTVHLARFVLGYLPTGKILVDFHGATPEEEEMLGNPVNAAFYAGVERTVISGVRAAVVVTEAMITHLKAKYPDCACEFILLPIMEQHDFVFAQRKPADDGRYTVIYAGGTQAWQNLPLMLDAAARANIDCRYVFLSHDQKRIAAEIARVCPDADTELAIAGREELPGFYARADLGFVLRDDTTVNRVACPTKLIEYMQFGIVPVVKSPQVGDFRAYGFEYVVLEEFIDGLIPSRAQLLRMAETNLAILNRIRAHFGVGAERLRQLELPNLVVGGGVRGLPIGLEPLAYPARRELYVFGDPNKYVADWIIGPYTEHVFQAGGHTGQLIRVVPGVIDFSCAEIAVEIEAAASGEVQIEVVQSRGRRIGGRDYFRAEAPFMEIKLSKPVAVASVKLWLSEPAFGPLIWRAIGLGQATSAPEAGTVRVSLVINGQRSEKSTTVKYV
jgi:hypothetical protein